MKQKKISMLKRGAAGIVLLVCVICYFVGGQGGSRRAVPSRLTGAGDAEMFWLEEAGTEEAAAGRTEQGQEEGQGQEAEKGQETERKEEGISEPDAAQTVFLFVHVCGAVRTPGVYELAEGSRVYQAVEAAGGLTEEAADASLNMAQILEDGMQLYVPNREEAEEWQMSGVSPEKGGAFLRNGQTAASGQASASGETRRVNLNTATREELMTLTGIGEARAEAILAYRTESGPFRSIEDIMKVSGIKEAAFQKIKEDITV